MFTNCQIISQYTRQQAIEDGVLIDITSQFPECSRIYKYPVAVTAGVWGILEQAVNNRVHCNDWEGLIWDLLYMSTRSITRKISDSEHLFQCLITGAGRDKVHVFRAVCGPSDDGSACITILLPDED